MGQAHTHTCHPCAFRWCIMKHTYTHEVLISYGISVRLSLVWGSLCNTVVFYFLYLSSHHRQFYYVSNPPSFSVKVKNSSCCLTIQNMCSRKTRSLLYTSYSYLSILPIIIIMRSYITRLLDHGYSITLLTLWGSLACSTPHHIWWRVTLVILYR